MAAIPIRDLLAAVLGIGLGLLLVVYPEAVVRVQTVGRVPGDRTGEYGQDATVPDTWRLIVRVLGVVVLGTGLFVGTRILL